MSAPDWRVGRSGAEQQLYLLDSGLHSDCTFRVGTPGENPQHRQDDAENEQTLGVEIENKPAEVKEQIKEFKLHRLLLAKASPVWESMLLPAAGSTQLSEAATGLVEIPDIPPSIFTHVLRHVYGDSRALSTLSYPEAEAVILVADKYQIPTLFSACQTRLCQGDLLDPVTVWGALRLVDSLHGVDKLRDACVRVLRERTTECLASPGFLESSESSVELLCSQDSLSLASEFPLVCSVVGWARGEATRRLAGSTASHLDLAIQDSAGCLLPHGLSTHAVLAPRLLPMLRLAAFSKQELETINLMADWLTQEEMQALKVGDVTKFPSTLSREENARRNENSPRGERTVKKRTVLQEKGATFKYLGEKSYCVLNATDNMWLYSFEMTGQRNRFVNEQNFGRSSNSSQYYEHLEFTFYHMQRATELQLRERNYISRYATSYKKSNNGSQINISLPTPLLLTKSTKLVIEVEFLAEGFYPIHQLSDTIRHKELEVYFYSEFCNGISNNHNFVDTITFRCE